MRKVSLDRRILFFFDTRVVSSCLFVAFFGVFSKKKKNATDGS